MCMFSQPIQHVADTSIFARAVADGRQLLAYQMRFSSTTDVAMVLPLPVPAGTPEGGLRFVDLSAYPDFFDDLRSAFDDTGGIATLGAFDDAGASAPRRRLAVAHVGRFVASFVPTLADFSRLDPRFRLSDGVWSQLPQYQRAGFAVFQLKRGTTSVHPMAFEFPRADPSRLFFPTVHVHDGRVHARAHFDHSIYCQAHAHTHALASWQESKQPASLFTNARRARGLLDGDGHVYFKALKGSLPNRDTLV